jgi:phosphoenolpyruvate carboxylase
MVAVGRAFEHFLTFANIAEQHHRIRRRRDYEAEGSPPQRGSMAEGLARLRAAGVSADDLHAAVCDLRIELVLTAHPTQVIRRTLLQRHRRIAELLGAMDRGPTPVEARRLREDLAREVLGHWRTDEVQRSRPTPVDEARGGLVAIEQSLWDAVPDFMDALDTALLAATGRGLPLDAAPIRFASWMAATATATPT